jgi:TonB-dependent starch-binding outer membrane protein SusC
MKMKSVYVRKKPGILRMSYLSFKRFAFLFVILMSSLILNAQNIQQVDGKVTGANGSSVAGVTVAVKGATTGTITDDAGNYTLKNVPKDATIVFSFLGMTTQEIPLNGKSKLDIVMAEANIGLEEVVVIGYGTTKKADLTGAVSVIKSDELKNAPVISVGKALQGLATGVFVRNSGAIGSEPSIEIRGIGSFSLQTPLYVIDGVPTTATRDFNAYDIESIQILKDASAAAIYGSRAGNGVIIITTKKGSSGAMKIDFSSKVSLQKLPLIAQARRDEWIKLYDAAYDNAIADGISGVTQRQQHPAGIDTDWLKEVFHTGVLQDYNLTLSGGNTGGNYLVSMNYLDDSGTAHGQSMNRINFRVNTEGIKGIFKIGENLVVSNTFINENNGATIYNAYRTIPTIAVRDSTHQPGGYGYGQETSTRSFGGNPIGEEDLHPSTNKNMRILGNVYTDVKILKSLTYRLNAGLEANTNNYKALVKSGLTQLNQPSEASSVTESKSNAITTLLENTLNYKGTFGKHNIDAIIGTTYQYDYNESITAAGKNLVKIGDYYFTTLNNITTNATVQGSIGKAVLISYLGRLNYSYDNRYLLSLTLRRDGSSRFAKANEWDNFPSISVGWRLSNEKFFHVGWINDLKLRANYGTLGNANIGYWDFVSTLNTFPIAVFGSDQHTETGMTVVKLVNSDIHWETKIQKNFGVDLAVLKSRLQLSGDYFISTTKDVLTALPILYSTGNDGGNPYVNAASLENRGIELTATWKENVGDFKYSATVNYTRLRNKVLDFGYGKTTYYTTTTITEIGKPLGMFYLVQEAGIFQTQDEINSWKNSKGVVIQPNAKPGDEKYIDANDDGQITSTDRVICGNPWPKFELGVNLNAEYKNFDLSMNTYGSFGQDAFNSLFYITDQLMDEMAARKGYDYWTPTNTSSANPRPLYGDTRNGRYDQTRWLEKASFYKLSQITLGYNLKSLKFFSNFDGLRVSVTGQNLLVLTKYKGLDPDFIGSSIWEKGLDNYAYPNPKTIIFSVNVTF